jgi:hypothetical protein
MTQTIAMKRLMPITLAMCAFSTLLVATPMGINYHEHVGVHSDGSADIVVTILSQDTVCGVLRLPWGFPGVNHVSAADSTAGAEIREENGLRFLLLTGLHPGRPMQVMLHVPRLMAWETAKRADFGNMTLTHQFRNTTTTRITQYRGEFLLPEGLTVTSVVSSIPEQTDKDPAAPFEIIQEGTQTGIVLTSANLQMGDLTSITFRCKPAEKSLVLFGVLAVAAGLYLIFFRDVLKENNNGPAAAENTQA